MKFCVIGLGRLGYQLATVLADNGMEVMAIDSNELIVSSIRDKVTQAICMRVTDETSLRNIGIEEMDTVIVATGENFAQSILITALLKKRLQMPKVITRAIDDIHKDILMLIGADQVILPEREIGIKLADILSSNFTDLTKITDDFSISHIKAPSSFAGKTIEDLNLFQTYHAHCIGVKEGEKIISIPSSYTVNPYDILVFSGPTKELQRIAKL
jgi:trk system potassium uptake protein